jgi:hypothetical protein
MAAVGSSESFQISFFRKVVYADAVYGGLLSKN